MTAQPEVRENVAEHRFEIWIADELVGFTVYQGLGQTKAFVHTEIDDRFGGRGLGSVLIRSALDSVRARGAEVLPYCPFVKAFIAKHPDYLDLVPTAQRSTFGLSATVEA
ncbi:MAG TPA: GNAT family N-acetyltransferase [Kineosporiaceae bacterium]|nr:GNAT family N-acetyltransferase [Kineosporiaceae bacterium]